MKKILILSGLLCILYFILVVCLSFIVNNYYGHPDSVWILSWSAISESLVNMSFFSMNNFNQLFIEIGIKLPTTKYKDVVAIYYLISFTCITISSHFMARLYNFPLLIYNINKRILDLCKFTVIFFQSCFVDMCVAIAISRYGYIWVVFNKYLEDSNYIIFIVIIGLTISIGAFLIVIIFLKKYIEEITRNILLLPTLSIVDSIFPFWFASSRLIFYILLSFFVEILLTILDKAGIINSVVKTIEKKLEE